MSGVSVTEDGLRSGTGRVIEQFRFRPAAGDGIKAAKQKSTSTMNSGTGEYPLVESGLPENDPERPRETQDEQSNR